jgi:hypothetical protein
MTNNTIVWKATAFPRFVVYTRSATVMTIREGICERNYFQKGHQFFIRCEENTLCEIMLASLDLMQLCSAATFKFRSWKPNFKVNSRRVWYEQWILAFCESWLQYCSVMGYRRCIQRFGISLPFFQLIHIVRSTQLLGFSLAKYLRQVWTYISYSHRYYQDAE